jgi:thiamine-phosphate pyrophosphorylase
MRLVIITPSKDVPDEISLVTKMFESGLKTLHLRKPRYSTGQMSAYLKEIPEHFHNRIMIHSHHDLALKFSLKGIHLSKTHLDAKKWRYFFTRLRLRLRFQQIAKSRSYTRLQQVYSPEEHHFNYFLIGTMFNNMTGELYSGFYEEGVTAANKTAEKQLVARGGTTPASITKALQYGFGGIAFNSYLWNSDQPYERFLSIIAEFKKQNIDPE